MKKIGFIAASALLVMTTAAFGSEGMKCGAGKCGGSMKEKPAMKCGAGKCGGMEKSKKKCGSAEKKMKKKAMKCGASKCGSK